MHSALFLCLIVVQTIRLNAPLKECFLYFLIGIGVGNAGPFELPFDDKIPVAIFCLTLLIRGRMRYRTYALFLIPTVVLAALSFLQSSRSITFDNFGSLLAFLMLLGTGFARFSSEEKGELRRALMMLPLINVIVGSLTAVLTTHNFAGIDSFGNFRLHGASIAAYLAAICFAALVAGAYELSYKINRTTLALAAVNGILLLLSGGRMPLVVTVLVILAALALSAFSRATVYSVSKLLVAVTLVAGAGILVYAFGGARVTALEGDQLLSGRELLWSYLNALNQGAGFFGNGFGEATKALREAALAPGTIAPHNEFLRFYFDLGYPSLLLLSLYLVVPFRNTNTHSAFGAWEVSYKLGLLLYALTDNVFTMPVSPLLLVVVSALEPPSGVNRGLGRQLPRISGSHLVGSEQLAQRVDGSPQGNTLRKS